MQCRTNEDGCLMHLDSALSYERIQVDIKCRMGKGSAPSYIGLKEDVPIISAIISIYIGLSPNNVNSSCLYIQSQ
jgi:hypothetical protein